MNIDMPTILDYLTALEQHNDRTWYHANKSLYQQANASFEELIGQLLLRLKEQDDTILLTEPHELTFKLVRDTRFSHDKSPYNPSFRTHMAPKGKLPIPVGYYLMIKPGNRSFLGGGLFADMFKDATAMIRNHIAAHGGVWQQIITSPAFSGHFTVEGSTLKKVPQGYDASHPQADYLKNKSWYVAYPLTDEQLLKADFVDFAVEIFAGMQPFNHFLNEALAGFQMPVR